jgi:hypothetical protein
MITLVTGTKDRTRKVVCGAFIITGQTVAYTQRERDDSLTGVAVKEIAPMNIIRVCGSIDLFFRIVLYVLMSHGYLPHGIDSREGFGIIAIILIKWLVYLQG